MLISLRNPNHDSSEDVSARSHWGLIQVPLNVRDIPQLVGTHPLMTLWVECTLQKLLVSCAKKCSFHLKSL